MAAGIGTTCSTNAQERLPAVPSDQYNEAQKKAADDFLAARKAPAFGPFQLMLHSPELMSLARGMGDYLRYKSAIGTTLSEFAVIITAREWTQDYEWWLHAPIAIKAGIKPEIVEVLRDGRRPIGMSEDEEIVYDFSTELHRNKRVSDATFARAEKRFGKQGVIDLVGINGYYTFLAMQLNTARYQIPKDAPPLPRFPD